MKENFRFLSESKWESFDSIKRSHVFEKPLRWETSPWKRRSIDLFPDNPVDAGVRNRKPGRSILGHAKTVFEDDPDETSVSDNADFLTFMLLRNFFQKSQALTR